MGLLDGDTALVTGAASGIGRGIARALAAEGTRLVLSDIATEAGQALARELGATFVFADLSDPAAARPPVRGRAGVARYGLDPRAQRLAQTPRKPNGPGRDGDAVG